MIAIVDYHMGNLHSVQKACAHAGAASRLVRTAAGIDRAKAVILPGVGAFGKAMHHLRRQGLIRAVRRAARSGRPFLGICLGMQLLFEASTEFGRHRGLALLPGRVVPFPAGRKVPHMGWNRLSLHRPHRLLAGVPDGSHMYFVHSYHCEPSESEDVVATTDYGGSVAAVVARGAVTGMQFHPEKSQALGLRIYANLARWLTREGDR